MFVRATSTKSNQSKMRLIRSNEKSTKKLFFTKTWIESQKQTQTKSQEIDKTKRKNSNNSKTNKKIYVQTLQTFDQIRQQYQITRTYSHSTREEIEICSTICWTCDFIYYFVCFIVSIDNFFIFFVIVNVIENFTFFDVRIRNCTRTFKKRIIKFLVDCNIKKIDILSRNNFTISHCIQIFSFFDCDIKIDLQYFEEIRNLLFVCFVHFVSNIYIIEILFHCERFVSHVRWKVEFIWFATTSNAFVFFSRFWQMQFRKQMWFYTKLHYVIFSCNNYICFQIDQIRNIWINTCSRKRFAQIFDFAMIFDFIYFFFFSIFFDAHFFLDIFAFFFCLQTLSKTFRHLLIYWLNHAKCFKNWKRWNIHENAFFTFRSLSFYFEKILIFRRKSHYFEKINMLFVCSFIFFY